MMFKNAVIASTTLFPGCPSGGSHRFWCRTTVSVSLALGSGRRALRAESASVLAFRFASFSSSLSFSATLVVRP